MNIFQNPRSFELTGGGDVSQMDMDYENQIKCLLFRGILLLMFHFSVTAFCSYATLMSEPVYEVVEFLFLEVVSASFLLFFLTFFVLLAIRGKNHRWWIDAIFFFLQTVTMSSFLGGISHITFLGYGIFLLNVGDILALVTALPALCVSYGTFNFKVYIVIFALISVPSYIGIQYCFQLDILQIIMCGIINIVFVIYLILDLNYYIEKESLIKTNKSSFFFPVNIYIDGIIICFDRFKGEF